MLNSKRSKIKKRRQKNREKFKLLTEYGLKPTTIEVIPENSKKMEVLKEDKNLDDKIVELLGQQ